MIGAQHAGALVRRAFVTLAILVAGATAAAELPNYYPAEGFRRTVVIDALIPEEQRIIVNDMSYALADNVIVHTPAAFSAPRSTLKVGERIAYRLGGGDMIVEIWTLPDDYVGDRQR